MAIFGQRLRKLREQKGITQAEISKALKMNRATYAHYETGRREPDIATLRLLAEYFNVSVDYLIGKTNERNSSPHEIYNAKELIYTIPEEYRELFKKQNISYIEFAKKMMKEKIAPSDLMELIRVTKNIIKKHENKEID